MNSMTMKTSTSISTRRLQAAKLTLHLIANGDLRLSATNDAGLNRPK